LSAAFNQGSYINPKVVKRREKPAFQIENECEFLLIRNKVIPVYLKSTSVSKTTTTFEVRGMYITVQKYTAPCPNATAYALNHTSQHCSTRSQLPSFLIPIQN
jgi:hypothetical protein